jgi:very-short-patch-repair endonuclease
MKNQEIILSWLFNENYNEIKEFLFRSKEEIQVDAMILAAIETVENEFVRLSKSGIDNSEFWDTLEMLHVFHPKYFELKPENHKSITLILAERSKTNLNLSMRYAKLYPDEEISKEIIKLNAETETQEIEHDNQEFIKLTHNPILENIDARTPLFKSEEERKLFLAMRQIFDTYFVYPNVAMSNVVNFDMISNQLTQQEKTYFYKSVIDFVVFDQLKGYQPVYFIELDSVWHDLNKVEEKDKMKDRIFSIAGLKLIRIRHRSNQPIEEDIFLELINEVRNQV